MTDVREVRCNAPVFEICVMSASVIPSEKYSCSGSRERLSKGRTAKDSIAFAPPTSGDRRFAIQLNVMASPTATATAASPKNHAHRLRETPVADVGVTTVESAPAFPFSSGATGLRLRIHASNSERKA